jgi:hypothetical protein
MKTAELVVILLIGLGLACGVVAYGTQGARTAEPVDHVVPGKSTGAGRNSLASPDK